MVNMINNQDIFDLVDDAFKSNGVIVQLGGRYVEEQYQYAQAVAQGLMEPEKALAILEAETGVGKSIGYLIPCLIFLSLHPNSEQVIISTFTRLLQKQIMLVDMPFAVKVVEALGLNPPKYGYRMGRQAFFSLERTHSTVERLKLKYSSNTAYIEQLEEFQRFAENSCRSGSGLWLDWLEDYYIFPDHIYSGDICLLYSGNIDNDAYVAHINNSSNALLLLTNHATLIGHDNVTDFVQSAYMVITDEAHHLDRLMAERSNKQLPVLGILNLFNRAKYFGIRDSYISEAKSFVGAWSEVIAQYDKGNGANDNFYISSGGHKQWLNEQVDYVRQIQIYLRRLEKDFQAFQKGNTLNHSHVEMMEQLQDALITLSHWTVANSFFYRALVFTDHNRTCSVAVVNPIASRLFAHTVKKLTARIMLTSATIFDARLDDDAVSIVGDLGFKHEEVTRYMRLSPSSYGEMKFILPSKEVSVPTSYDRDNRCNRFNQIWLEYTARMLVEASKTGPTLALTYSFEESRLLSECLRNMGVSAVTQEKGIKLLEILPTFLNGEASILITPSGWDGLNIRTEQNTQFLKNVIITRLPNAPKNELEDFVAREYMLNKNMPQHVVDNIIWLKHINFCIRVLKQGLGRGIRSPYDSIYIWFADPRMPYFNSPKARPLINAIPARFMDNYARGTIFEIDGTFDVNTNADNYLDIVL